MSGSRRSSVHVITVASRNLWLLLETTPSLVEISRLRVAINAYRIRLRVVTTAAKSELLVASRNLWLRVVTKTWWTETSVASRNLGCESQPPLSRLGYFGVIGLWLLGFLLTGLRDVTADCMYRADPITQLFVYSHVIRVCYMYCHTCSLCVYLYPTWPIFGNHVRTWWPTYLTG